MVCVSKPKWEKVKRSPLPEARGENENAPAESVWTPAEKLFFLLVTITVKFGIAMPFSFHTTPVMSDRCWDCAAAGTQKSRKINKGSCSSLVNLTAFIMQAFVWFKK